MNNSIWNTCIGEAIRKAKLSGTLIPLNEVDEIIIELEKLKRTNPKEPETVHGNEAGKEVNNRFTFQYKSVGRELYVTIKAKNLNEAMKLFAKKYHYVEQVFSIEKVLKNDG